MAYTDKFRSQHDEILGLAKELTDHTQRAGADAPTLRKQLSNLAGKVNFHLAMEDKALYPRLMVNKGSQAEAMAARFMTEMGGLARVFTEYNARWQVSAIKADLPGFANESRKVLGALAHRIARENTELYPVADVQADAASA